MINALIFSLAVIWIGMLVWACALLLFGAIAPAPHVKPFDYEEVERQLDRELDEMIKFIHETERTPT